MVVFRRHTLLPLASPRERVFGHLKRNLNLRSPKLKGPKGAAEEFTMAATAYDLQLLANRAAPA